MTSGTTRNEPMIETLPKERNVGPTTASPTMTTIDEGQRDRGDRARQHVAPSGRLSSVRRGERPLSLIARTSARGSRRSPRRSTRIIPCRIVCRSEEKPKKTSEVGIVERKPTLRKSPQRFPLPPGERDPGEDHRGDHVEEEVVRRARVERPDRGGEEHRPEADEAARRHEGGVAGLAQRDAAHLRREAVAADRDRRAGRSGSAAEAAGDEHQHHHRPPDRRQPEDDRPSERMHAAPDAAPARAGTPGTARRAR